MAECEEDKNTNNEVHPDINDFGEDLPRFPLGKKKGEKFGLALAKKKRIIEIAQMLQAIADFGVEAEQESLVEEQTAERKLRRQVSVRTYFSSCLGKVFETLDIVLVWLEQSSKQLKDERSQARLQTDETDAGTEDCDDSQTKAFCDYNEKREGVLRGLYHITGLGSFPCRVGLLELACKFLDLPENPYAAKREHVKECLRQVEEQKEEVFELIEKACKILEEITRDPQVNQSKAAEFNSTVRQANVLIDSCNDFLSLADKTIDELIQIMRTMKIFSRVLRFAGFGITCLGLYQMRPANPAMKYFTFATATAVAAGYGWLSLFPSKVYGFLDDLEKFKFKHARLTLEINRLDRRLKNAVKDFDDKSKQQQSWEDSI
ncbi:uncharacterized protein LOC114521874 [Dendronephthya gigantea]|uniref:uncharacterized protein LOC114521874 n=1 Tax=Dendronephthya gigantea TaxID=151771 RepID=UPI00106930E5|nr:uncharacterized protein LOC114521874 [Dendronephthya gigantea]